MKTAHYAGLALIAGFGMAAPPLGELPLQPESKVWVAGGSTVRDYRCTATAIDASIIAPAGETATMPLAGLVSAATISIPVAKLDCANGTMNDHMRKALKVKDAPKLIFKLENYRENNGELLLNGTLTIAGTTRAIQLLGTIADSKGIVRATGMKEIRMTEWGVKPPTLMLGTMKVDDKVTIGFDVTLKR